MFAPGNINRVINLNAHKDDDDGFWSDDDKNPIQMFAKPKNQSNNNLPEIQQIPELTDNTGPIDKDDELMTAIIQTASKQKTIIGKDEIEYDNFAMKNQQQKQIQQIQPNIPQVAQQQNTERKRHKHSSKNSGEKRHRHHKSSRKNDSSPQISASSSNPNINQQYATQIPQTPSQPTIQLSSSEQAKQMRLHALGYHTSVPASTIYQQNQRTQQQQVQQPNYSGYDTI